MPCSRTRPPIPSFATSSSGPCTRADARAERTGWEPHHLTLWSGTELKAAAPLYRKHHSYGEYVFDWAWADAHQRHGIDYYPKWLVGDPVHPGAGPAPAGRRCRGARRPRGRAAAACRGVRPLVAAHALPSRGRCRAARCAGPDDAALGAVPLVQPRLRGVRRLPRGADAAEAQEGARGAPQGRRRGRDVRPQGRLRHRRGRLGVLRALLCAHVRRASLDAVPDARLLPRTGADDARDAAARGRAA